MSLRVGINFGNTVLAHRDRNGRPAGIAADLAAELARRLDVPIEFVTYDAAGRMADGAKAGAWDVAFLAADPDRANEIAFTEPYLEIESTYVVPADSHLRTPSDVDREGLRIALSEKSAYDLYLTRNLKHARLVRAPGPAASVELFLRENLDALAGIRPMLLDVVRSHPGLRVLDGGFMAVQQAIGTPRGGEVPAKFLQEFVRDIKVSGFVAKIIQNSGIPGIAVAP